MHSIVAARSHLKVERRLGVGRRYEAVECAQLVMR